MFQTKYYYSLKFQIFGPPKIFGWLRHWMRFVCYWMRFTTLFADDTYLMLADKNLANLERRVNEELQNIDHWLKKK